MAAGAVLTQEGTPPQTEVLAQLARRLVAIERCDSREEVLRIAADAARWAVGADLAWCAPAGSPRAAGGHVCAPVAVAGRAFAALYVSDRGPRRFGEDEVDLVTLIAAHAGEALRRLDQHEEARRLLGTLVEAQAAQQELVDLADALADTCSVTAGLRRLAARFVVEMRLHDQFGNIVARAGDVRGTPVLHIPLHARDHDLGGLEVIAAERLAPDAAGFISTAARLLVLQILRDRSRLEARLELRSEFVAALLGDPHDHREELRCGAALLGLDLSAPAVILRVAAHGEARATGTDPELVVRAVGEAAAEHLGRAVVALHEGAVVLVANAVDEADTIRTRLQELVALASIRLPQTPLCAGLGRPCARLEQYADAHRQATVALQVALEQPAPRLVASDELGIYGLLASAAPGHSLREFVAQTLGALVEADAHSSCDYVNTLSVFLSCDRNLERTARELYVHVNTVRYRLARAREISGLDLRNVETRFRVELALKARSALQLAADERRAC